MGDHGKDARDLAGKSRPSINDNFGASYDTGGHYDADEQEEGEVEREFVPAKRDVAQLSALADLEKLSVVRHNVLSQMGARRLLRPDMSYMDAGLLNIAQRRQRLLRCVQLPGLGAMYFVSNADHYGCAAARELLSLDADVLCLQEVDDYDDWWVGQLSVAGYDSVYARARGADHGLVTAFRHDQFQLFRPAEVDLNDLCDRINDPNLAARARQNNIALLVCLQPWEKSRLPSAICVTNTQLASSPSLEHVRVLQAEFLCREIATFNADFHLPIVLAGTFNAVPSSDVYHVVMTGRRRPSPQAPAAPMRPIATNATLSSLTVRWEIPQGPPHTERETLLEHVKKSQLPRHQL